MSLIGNIGRVAVAAATVGVAALGLATDASAVSGAPTLGYRYTTSGDGVKCVQHDINYVINTQNPSSPPPYRHLDEDGVWGPKTDADVRWFQSWYGNLDVDGVVGRKTGNALLYSGDPNWNGDPYSTGPGPCYWKLPSDNIMS